MNHNGHFDFAELKRLANGRWLEILPRLAGIGPEFLTGNNGPCPKCQTGENRWRFANWENNGGGICNQCARGRDGKGLGDGFDVLEWYLGWEPKKCRVEIAKFLGIDAGRNGKTNGEAAKPNGQASKSVMPCAVDKKGARILDKVGWPSSAVAEVILKRTLPAWCRKKPPITPEAAYAYFARICTWPTKVDPRGAMRCVVFPGRLPSDGGERIAALLLYRPDGTEFPAFRTLTQRKTHLVGGSEESWLWPGDAEVLTSAQVVVKCEGLPDALALHSAGLPAGWVAITNACGAGGSLKKLDFAFAAGKRVVVVGDADEPGQVGARGFAAAFHQAGASEVRLVSLPYETTANHGKDLRDYIQERI